MWNAKSKNSCAAIEAVEALFFITLQPVRHVALMEMNFFLGVLGSFGLMCETTMLPYSFLCNTYFCGHFFCSTYGVFVSHARCLKIVSHKIYNA